MPAFPPALVLLSGLPGTGKTTFARELARRVPVVHVESDAIRRACFAVPRYTQAESAAVFAQVEREAAAALAAGHIAVVDATNLTSRDRARFVRLATSAAVRFVAVRMTAPDELVLVRLEALREGASQADGAVFLRMRGRPQAIGQAHLVVDTRYPIAPSLTALAALLEESSS